MTIKIQLVYHAYGDMDIKTAPIREEELLAGAKIPVAYHRLDSGYQPATSFGEMTVIDEDTVQIHTEGDRWHIENIKTLSKKEINEPDELLNTRANGFHVKVEIQEKLGLLPKLLLRFERPDLNLNIGTLYTRVYWSQSKER